MFEAGHQNAFRLFNGFLEGYPELAVDIYGATAILFDHAEAREKSEKMIRQTVELLQKATALAEGRHCQSKRIAGIMRKRGEVSFLEKTLTGR